MTTPTASPAPTAAPSETGMLVSWTEGIGDSAKSHMVHVASPGLTWALKCKPSEEFDRVAATAAERPAEAAALVQSFPGGQQLPRQRIARVTYAKGLDQLTVFDTAGKKQRIASGGRGEQGTIFEAIRDTFGGTAGEEEADAWSVMQTPLFVLSVIGVIGGFFIYMTTISEPSYEASGRRSGMKQLINWLGYTIGPMWMSVMVGGLALLVASMMVHNLIKRPKRQTLDLSPH